MRTLTLHCLAKKYIKYLNAMKTTSYLFPFLQMLKRMYFIKFNAKL